VEKLAYSPNEVAEMLGVNHHTVREAIKRGEIGHVRVGRRILVPRQALETLLDALTNINERVVGEVLSLDNGTVSLQAQGGRMITVPAAHVRRMLPLQARSW
jgi:excisionase family DNA binding protein